MNYLPVGPMKRHAPMAVVPTVLMEHVQECASLRLQRTTLVRAADGDLFALARLDGRIAAHVDGIAVGGELGREMTRAASDVSDRGSVFVSAVRALEDEDATGLASVLALALSSETAWRGTVSAFGWVAPAKLRGVVKALLNHADPNHQGIGLEACAVHGVDPGPVLPTLIDAPAAATRARALRLAGRCGRTDLLERCVDLVGQENGSTLVAAAIAAVSLGDRGRGLHALEAIGLDPGLETSTRLVALRSVCKVLEIDQAAALLKRLAREAGLARTLLVAVGQVGRTQYVPWLVERMHEAPLARVAGEALTLITGVDIEAEGLARAAPGDHVDLVDDDPSHERVEMDEDDGLAWPDPDRMSAWWREHEGRFAVGTRTFMGRVPDRDHCVHVLRIGTQRQRLAAAEHLHLLDPGKPLFNVAAPAWRQQRLLDGMAT